MPSGHKTSDVPSIYQPLFEVLAAATDDEVVLTFAEIAALMGRRYLPESAVLSSGWWVAKKSLHVQTWQAMGWRAHADRNARLVRFTR
jgi:hypothetical protein